MNAQQDNLTPGERQFLERMQEAEKEGVSLQDYFRSRGLGLPAMYAVRNRLIQKGHLPSPRAARSRAKRPSAAGPFAAVRVAAPAAIAGQGLGGCRLRSPGGWVIECDGLPEISWVQRLMGVQS
jgi:hypothetical protein